jgi:hypothetical protein
MLEYSFATAIPLAVVVATVAIFFVLAATAFKDNHLR